MGRGVIWSSGEALWVGPSLLFFFLLGQQGFGRSLRLSQIGRPGIISAATVVVQRLLDRVFGRSNKHVVADHVVVGATDRGERQEHRATTMVCTKPGGLR